MFVGRDDELAEIAGLLDTARSGRGATLRLLGEPGIGKSTLLAAAHEAAPDFRRLAATGVQAEAHLAHSGLLSVAAPLAGQLDDVPEPQRVALTAALGWTAEPGEPADRRYLVAAGTLSLLAAAAASRPVLILLDDVQWLDRETVAVLAFAARRLTDDPVAFLVADRGSAADREWSGFHTRPVPGLATEPARALLAGVLAAPLVDRLVALTNGNPLALLEAVRGLTPEQRRGSSPWPDALPVGGLLTEAFARPLRGLSVAARRAAVLAAASADGAAPPIVAALTADGHDPEAALAEAERAGLLVVGPGTVGHRHPLLRAATWASADGAERRSAHRALAAGLGADQRRAVHHLGYATTGYDEGLAARLRAEAGHERARGGYGSAAALAERAAQLSPTAGYAADCRADAVEDALLAGDPTRVRRLAAVVLEGPVDGPAAARVRLALGTLDSFAGSVPRARDRLTAAAAYGRGLIRLRALTELALVNYRLGEPAAVSAVARSVAAESFGHDPEQEMLARYTEGAALAFTGGWAEAHPPLARALHLLEDDPGLRDDPRYLAVSLLTPAWMGEPERVGDYLDRRLDQARAQGALGVLPLALSLVAGGAMLLGHHQIAYAYAGEAVELGTELGYVIDVAIAHQVLAWQFAARGLPGQAADALAAARRLEAEAEVAAGAVHIELVDAFAALCRGDLTRVCEVLERRIAVDGGRLPRGDYPLAVAPDLVEAHLGLGRPGRAGDLAREHADLYLSAPDGDVRGQSLRLRGLVAADEQEAEGAFVAAHAAHAQGSNPFEAARTRLLHGIRLRRAGQRRAARDQLRPAATAFEAMGLDGWTMRAHEELAATGERSRRGPQAGDQLSPQETRVALMVARGLPNREIAAALFLSPKTIERHVTSALRKRGLRSRTALAIAFLADRDAGPNG